MATDSEAPAFQSIAVLKSGKAWNQKLTVEMCGEQIINEISDWWETNLFLNEIELMHKG